MKKKYLILLLFIFAATTIPGFVEAADIPIIYHCNKTFVINFGNLETKEVTFEKKYRQLSANQKSAIDRIDQILIKDKYYTYLGPESNRQDCGGYTMSKLWKTGVVWTTGSGFFDAFIKPALTLPNLKDSGMVNKISWDKSKTGDVAVYGGTAHITYVAKRNFYGSVFIETKDGEEKVYTHDVPGCTTDFWRGLRNANHDHLQTKYNGAPTYYRIDTSKVKVTEKDNSCECDESPQWGKELDDRMKKAKSALKDCEFQDVYDELEPIIKLAGYTEAASDGTNGQEQLLIRCRVGIDKDAQKIIDKAKDKERQMKKAEDNLDSAARKLRDAQDVLHDIQGYKNEVNQALSKSKSALSSATLLLNTIRETSDKCDKIKQLIRELKTVVDNANREAQGIPDLYQTIKNTRQQVCTQRDEAKNMQDRDYLRKIADQASAAAKSIREPSKNIGRKSQKTKEYANRAMELWREISALQAEIDQINQANRNIIINARSKLNEGIVSGAAISKANAAQIEGNQMLKASQTAVKLVNDAIKIVKDNCPDTPEGKYLTSLAITLLNMAANTDKSVKKLIEEIKTLIKEIEQQEINIQNKLKTIPDEKNFQNTCKLGNLPDVEEARASADTAQLFASKANADVVQAEKCASDIRQMVEGSSEKSFFSNATDDPGGPPLVPAGMRVTHWGERSDEGVDGWVPFKFNFSLPAGKIVRADFFLVVRPIGQLIETDTFHCIDSRGEWKTLYNSFTLHSKDRPSPVKVTITEKTHPTVIEQLNKGSLRCCVQDDTALFSAQVVLYWE